MRCIVICINSAPTQMIDGTEKTQIPSKSAKHAARYNEFDSKSNGFFNQFTSVKMLATILIFHLQFDRFVLKLQ